LLNLIKYVFGCKVNIVHRKNFSEISKNLARYRDLKIILLNQPKELCEKLKYEIVKNFWCSSNRFERPI